jgi:hypothetical protein
MSRIRAIAYRQLSTFLGLWSIAWTWLASCFIVSIDDFSIGQDASNSKSALIWAAASWHQFDTKSRGYGAMIIALILLWLQIWMSALWGMRQRYKSIIQRAMDSRSVACEYSWKLEVVSISTHRITVLWTYSRLLSCCLSLLGCYPFRRITGTFQCRPGNNLW